MSKSKKRVWSAVSQEFLCRTPYLNVRKDAVLYPHGRIHPYLVVERHDFAVIVPRFPNGDVLMVRQYRYPLRKYTWEFPMGVVKGVSMLKAAKVELKQETGYRAKKWTFLGKYYVAAGMTAQRAHLYLAEGLIEGTPEPEEGEFITLQRLSQAVVARWVRNGTVQDGPTLMAWNFSTN